MKTITVRPRDFIHPPFIRCPKCGNEAFGVASIMGNKYLRRCRECLYPNLRKGEEPVYHPLPKLDKKVVYLDQLALSNMMKGLNPHTKAHRRGIANQFWRKLYERLDSLCKLQLVVCPKSGFHTDESLLSPYFGELRRMYTLLSCGVSFYDAETIERFQICEHVKSWMAGEPSREPNLDVHSVTHGEINSWQERFVVMPNPKYIDALVEDLRKRREAKHEGISKVFQLWQTESNRHFDDWFEEESLGLARRVIPDYLGHALKLKLTLAGRLQFTISDVLLPPSVVLLLSIQRVLKETGVLDSEIWPMTVEYLTSPSLRNVPCVKIGCMLWAAVARKAATGGKKAPPNQGMAIDVRMISTLLPYCDAMFIDKECHGYLREVPLREEINYGTKVFSMSNKDEFLDYLNEIEASASKKHLVAVEEVYGKERRKPYTTLYRERNDYH